MGSSEQQQSSLLSDLVTGEFYFQSEAALAKAASVLWWVAEGRLGAGAAIFYGWMG